MSKPGEELMSYDVEKAYIGSLDQGTSSTRFIIFNHDGELIAQDQLEHEQILPSAGWVEHDANEIWQRCKEVIIGALGKAGITGSQLSAIGIANQRETVLIWDAHTGQPLHNAIVWQDTRTTDFLEALNQSQKELITQLTGLPVAPYFSASKIHWLINHSEAVKNALVDGRARCGTIDSWLLYKLSDGKHYTDVTNASRTLLMNIETLAWDQRLLDIFGIPLSLLPEIKSSSEVYAHTTIDGPFNCEIPIAALLGDQHAAMIGQVAFNRGDSKTTYGTGNFALLNTGTEVVRSSNGLITTLCYKLGNQPAHYALEGSIAVTGSAVQWLRDQLGIINTASEVEDLASQVNDTSGVYFVPAFSGLFAPYWRSDARGVIVGMTRATNRFHIARATLESICYQTRDVLDAMAADSGVALREMRVDGGATTNELLMQMQADILGVEIVRPEITETTALGAAYSAGLAVGFWSNLDEITNMWQLSRRWKSQITDDSRSQGYLGWKKAIERTFNWA